MTDNVIYGVDFKAPEKLHWSDCAVNNAPALPVGPCNCGGFNPVLDTTTGEYCAPYTAPEKDPA